MQTTTEAAEENLRVIRSLMEKATIYRAVSAHSALVGGILAIIMAGILSEFRWGVVHALNIKIDFVGAWLVVLIVATMANLQSLRREAALRDEKFFSSGMRTALVSLLPSFLTAAVFTVIFWIGPDGGEVTLVCIWMIFYGLGLLATAHFAPRSIRFLGWAFLLVGLTLFFWTGQSKLYDLLFKYFYSWNVANIIMGVTFGGFHLIYAACTWPRRAASVEAASTPSTDV